MKKEAILGAVFPALPHVGDGEQSLRPSLFLQVRASGLLGP